MPRLVHALIALLALLAFAAPTARANSSLDSIFQDDAVLLNGHPGPSLDLMRGLGVTTIHSLVFWNKVAPHPTSRTRAPFVLWTGSSQVSATSRR